MKPRRANGPLSGKDPDDSGAALDLLVEPLEQVRGLQVLVVLAGQAVNEEERDRVKEQERRGELARPARRTRPPTHGVDGREGQHPRQQTNRGEAGRVDLPAPERRAAQDRVGGEGDHRRRRHEADVPDPRHGVRRGHHRPTCR